MLKWKTNKPSGAKTAIGKKYSYGYSRGGILGLSFGANWGWYLTEKKLRNLLTVLDIHVGFRVKTFALAKQIAELIEK